MARKRSDPAQRVKRFLPLGGVWIKDTTDDRVTPIADPYESGDERAMNVDPIKNVPAVRGGYDLD